MRLKNVSVGGFFFLFYFFTHYAWQPWHDNISSNPCSAGHCYFIVSISFLLVAVSGITSHSVSLLTWHASLLILIALLSSATCFVFKNDIQYHFRLLSRKIVGRLVTVRMNMDSSIPSRQSADPCSIETSISLPISKYSFVSGKFQFRLIRPTQNPCSNANLFPFFFFLILSAVMCDVHRVFVSCPVQVEYSVLPSTERPA